MESGTQTRTRAVRARRGLCRRCGGAEEFAVTVDLSRFYRDERARVLLRACGRRRARWLLARVTRALGLPPRPGLALLAAGRLLPPAEPLRLLRDPHATVHAGSLPLQVIPLPEHWHGYEGLRDSTSTCSTDRVDAPEPEPNSGNMKSTHIQTEQHTRKMEQELISEVQSKHEPDQEMEQEPECEPQSNHCDVSLELQKVKERALALLDRCCEAPAGGPRRPRVRRRRRRAVAVAASPPLPVPPASAAADPPLVTSPTVTIPPVTVPPATVPPATVPPATVPPANVPPRSPSVRRNRSPLAATTPRLVRALC